MKQVGVRSVRPRMVSLALGASVAAIVAGTASPAAAQCTPDPTVANGMTTCTGMDANGLRVPTSGTTVNVTQGAIVSAPSGSAITVEPNDPNSTAPVRLNVSGTVSGPAGAGLNVLSGPNFSYQPRTIVVVAASGRIAGADGIRIGLSPGRFSQDTVVDLDNSGVIAGASGVAIAATDSNFAGVQTLVNRVGGSIGAIATPVGTLTNAGTIDGGGRSALQLGSNFNFAIVEGPVTNTGAIRNNSVAATIANLGHGSTLTNNGVIANAGAGAAVAVVSQQSNITNEVGARIATAGTTAITVLDSLGLTNRGAIQGGVSFASRTGFLFGSTIDSTAGTIMGDVSFGNGDDTLAARYIGGRTLATGITGSINGGGGVNTVRVAFTGDTSVAMPIDLFTNFQRLGLSAASGTTITLAEGFVAPGTLQVSGPGSFVNRAALTTAGQAIGGFGSSIADFTNEGAIRTTGATGAASPAVNLFVNGTFANRGTITSAGAGVSVSASRGVTNAGDIVAAGTALAVSSSGLTNTGLIRSTGGTGLILSGSVGTIASNSGRIEGVTGVQLSGHSLANTGTIQGSTVGVALQAYGTLDNRAGGAVNGGVALSGGAAFQATVANAGTINGDVNIAASSFGGTAGNRFLALSGGVLNGNLTLGQGDLLYTDLLNTSPGRFAGITGTVTANGSDLRYRVGADATEALGTATGFRSVGYELSGATLTLTGATIQTLTLAGDGVVELAGDIGVTNRAAISRASLTRLPGEGFSIPTGGLTVSSRGSITAERADRNVFIQGAIVLNGYYSASGADSFTNFGTITVRDRTGSGSAGQVAITGADSVTNNGSILLDNALGVSLVRTLTNTGLIGQLEGGGTSRGVYDVAELVNSGTISVAGTAVGSFLRTTITNSGTIASTGGAAIGELGSGSVINNQAGGSIAGRVAITTQGATVINAGSMTGAVNLGFSRFSGSFAPSAFVSAGGTVMGDVLFGSGGDLFLQTGEATGVTGVIDGGEGYDTFGRSFSSSATIAIGVPGGRNFEAELIQARGADTVVTITGESSSDEVLYLGGDGRIVNRATMNALTTTEPLYYPFFYEEDAPEALGLGLVLQEVRNEGALNGGFYGQVRSFINTGSVGTTVDDDAGLRLDGFGEVSLDNSGTIIGSDGAVGVDINQATRVSITNSGTITGGLYGEVSFAGETPGALTIANSGDIVFTGEFDPAVDLFVDTFDGAGSLSLTNNGLISSASPVGMQIGIEGDQGGGFSINNGGRIEASGSGSTETFSFFEFVNGLSVRREVTVFTPARALSIYGGGVDGGTIVNSGTIAATGADSIAVLTTRTALNLTNSGTIQGGQGSERTASDLPFTIFDTLPYLAGAVQSLRTFDDRVLNSGTITGSIDLGAGHDRIENRGLIDGAVFLRSGDDTYLQGAGGSLTGVVDGGEGTDVIAVDAAGNGAVAGDRFANFERLTQSGTGSVSYAGAFAVPTLELSGGTARVEAGRRFATAGTVAVTGSDRAEGVEVAGTLAGAVSLGVGDDLFAEIGEGRATGLVDGGEGVDLYRVTLVGDREGLSANGGFERLAVDGAGTLSLTLGQAFDSATVSGAGLDVRLNGFAIGAVEGSAGAERFAADGDVARVSMGTGDDAVRLMGASFAGLYEGGAGNDVLRLSGEGPATLSGTATGFETVAVDGGALTVTGALGGTAVSFGDGAQAFAVADGGRAQGAFDLGAGDDRFRLMAGGLLAGSVAGGAGRDAAAITLASDRTFGANTLTGFELLSFDGAGASTLTLDQALESVALAGVGLDVRLGGFAIGAVEGSAGAERFAADGDVARAALGAGDDLLSLGGVTLAGRYDGGAGADTLRFVGATTLTGQAVGFEALALEQVTALTVRGVLSEAGERLLLDDGAQTIVNAGRIGGSLDFGGGDDVYAEGAGAVLGGAVDGGAGADLYRVTLAGDRAGLSATSGFERLELGGSGALTATLGQSFERVALDGVGFAATLSGFAIGAVEGGAGAERFSVDGDVARVAMGGGDDVLAIGAAAPAGGYDGGAGSDLLRLTRASTLSAGRATNFEFLSAEGANGLTLTGGAFAFAQVDAASELRVATDAALTGAVRFGGGDNRFLIAGGYQGSVAGGAGVDTLEVSGGSAATPVAFGSIAEVEAFRMTGGYATLSGVGALGSVDLSGGRLVGLAGSAMSASAFNVRQGATFGSAGTVNGDVAVAGVLSPGASPGVMTVNGNVALAGTSVSVFEITPAASDRLVVNGAVSIANGATLQIVPTGQLQPGASLDLITASAGITGSFTNVVKPDSLFGFLVQQGGRLSLLGQFRNDASFSGQVGDTIDYANSVLVSGRANAALLAAAPGLVGANGTSNAGAFALLAPEAYASARQAAVEQGLTLADAGRGAGFANRRAEPGLFTFGQFAADQRTLRADETRGTARAKFGGYGLFGGLGYAGETWSLGGFVGYLDGRQRLDGRGATTELTGAAFGVHGRTDVGPFGLTATAAYAATEADTRRALPGGSARGTYDLTNLTLDVAATYEVAIGGEWSLRPRIGGTVVRVERDRVAETGSAAFAAQVAADEDTAAFVDGALTAAKTGAVRPFATLGLRYQAAGRDSLALTGFGGGGLGLVVEGAERARVLGTAALGVEADLRPGLTLFSAVAAERGEDDRRESARIGLRASF